MFGLIAAGIAGVAGVVGHIKSRHFVGQRLRYTKIVEKPMLGLWTGLGTVVIAAPIPLAAPVTMAFFPIVGAGTAIALGAGVGTGVALGVSDSKEPPKLLEDDY